MTMTQNDDIHNRIPISVALDQEFNQPELSPGQHSDKKRLVYIASLAIGIAAIISILAKGLIYLINLITNLSFHQSFSLANSNPAPHSMGLWVMLVPAIGGLL